ncbi:hypothetical protein FRC03_010212 [Tulasnella sp. 419]|nr:hypothetical protein FRC03_010212 [Tulasnella sp. 419]
MALAASNDDHGLVALWQLVAELSEQLNTNRAATAALQQQAGHLKDQAVHNGTGFALRRFNTDLSKEVFESELERMNAALVIENQNLQQENKQLNVLLKEYEQTLETVMSKFRSQAHAAQQHELTLTRHYESLLLARESSTLNQELAASTQISQSLSRLSYLIRQALRANGGEEPEPDPAEVLRTIDPETGEPIPSENTSSKDLSDEMGGGYSADAGLERDDWALEREIEITRLEKENEELRKLLGIDATGAATIGATEEEWSNQDFVERRRMTGLGFRSPGSSSGIGRKPSLFAGRGGGHMGLGGGMNMQRAVNLTWREREAPPIPSEGGMGR